MDLQFKDNVYMASNGEGPFCSRCYDVEGKDVHMHSKETLYFCPECQTTVSK